MKILLREGKLLTFNKKKLSMKAFLLILKINSILRKENLYIAISNVKRHEKGKREDLQLNKKRGLIKIKKQIIQVNKMIKENRLFTQIKLKKPQRFRENALKKK